MVDSDIARDFIMSCIAFNQDERYVCILLVVIDCMLLSLTVSHLSVVV